MPRLPLGPRPAWGEEAAGRDAATVTSEGADWLARSTPYPRSTLALWRERPHAPLVLPCGRVFDIVNLPVVFGRRVLDRLWDEGPGCGPVATHRGRLLVFAAPGTAQRLPALLEWEEWGGSAPHPDGGSVVPPLLCHGAGDAVTAPALSAAGAAETARGPRWLVAPDTRRPWLPGPEVLLWTSVRAARGAVRITIFPPRDQGANVYDVSRRR
ncbi:bifunctional DNA primase/polymerase [Streptomyces tsukubensis]|uniref:bifunctional DNA primase/polymerase n=1 Tax=Streptomyces tsukubensis TaxID=83656 RepID=UPI00351D899C